MGRKKQPTDKNPSNIFVGGGGPKRLNLRKIAVIAAIVLLILGGVGAYFFMKSADEKAENALAKRCHPNSSESITKEAAIILDPGKDGSLRDLEAAIAPIKADPEHEQDPNCLYPLLRFYIADTDPANAQKYFDKFEAVYDKGFAKDFYAFDLETLRGYVAHLKVLEKEAESNFLFSDPVAPEDLVE